MSIEIRPCDNENCIYNIKMKFGKVYHDIRQTQTQIPMALLACMFCERFKNRVDLYKPSKDIK